VTGIPGGEHLCNNAQHTFCALLPLQLWRHFVLAAKLVRSMLVRKHKS